MVEYPIHDRAERVLLAAGASLIGTPIDEDGIVARRAPEHARPVRDGRRWSTLIPSFHNPTGWTTPAAARERVVDLVITQNLIQTEQILLVEDETYALTRFEGERVPAHLRLLGQAGACTARRSRPRSRPGCGSAT